mmetsp:Transcript_9533/g.28676  ORF Transcript_9533/g.28676 Transcript_9533/m.28676 type:complete len:107 (-) Transcript_9533:475-795(-)|eukprot:CAMPEP_0206150120 /NCGR_PEP_ID=MMETSP1473-20131121/38133_1 /ASSEMBLY_ACC=CAM_ASM_001109 /TAXON_ID=1461547 /ORGANISM="Stichococcus sp, Strain RCC1054" /LENGTH=106 /DNA_ID=CAMNT_0053547611 /DNA_START=713 /DNA_END=1033 /DNA_ORIENTATION=-
MASDEPSTTYAPGDTVFEVLKEKTGGPLGGAEGEGTSKVGTFDSKEEANAAAKGALNSKEFAAVEISESKASGLAIVTGERADGNEVEVFVVEKPRSTSEEGANQL